ncbi:hypothetical protein F4821DRAFT_235595, partial [Hypoxylon rubiginosum]
MSAADYYGNSGGGSGSYPPQHHNQSSSPYPQQPQYAQPSSQSPYPQHQPSYASPSPAHSPYPQQPSYSPAPPQQHNSNYLAPYPSQPQYARPGSAHSDAGYPPPYPGDEKRPGSAGAMVARPHSADPYGADRGQQQYAPGQEGADGERGLGATLLGGGAGGFLGHKIGKGKLGTLLGGAVGAVAANMIEHKFERKNSSHSQGHGSSSHYGGGQY